MKYKLIIFDIDGTLVPSILEGLPSKKVIEAVHKAHNSINITVATGRPYHYSEKILRTLKIKGPCVLDGGSEIRDITSNRILFKSEISINTQKEIIKICLPYEYSIFNSNAVREKSRLKSLGDIKEKTGKIVVSGLTENDSIKILEELTAVDEISAHPVSSSWANKDRIDLHITKAGSTKKESIKKLLGILNIDKKDSIGVGDSLNDMPLFLSVGFKVAMGQAPKELKEIADYVAPSIEDDGVVDIIEKFIL
jgi:hypothetical protein